MRYILEKFGFQPVGLDGQEMKNGIQLLNKGVMMKLKETSIWV